jgi:carbonic anhydrase/acetyltransferase-like protein (isoleucine patch superfamily)
MNTEDRLKRFLHAKPQIAEAAFVASNATLMGDIETIRIGEGTNVQDGCIIHLADNLGATVGAYCTVGHAAIIHACTIGDLCLVGMQAVILDGAEIGDECLIGAGALLTSRTKIPPRSLVLGAPAKVVRQLTEAEMLSLRASAEKYITVSRAHAALQTSTK